MQQNVSAVSKQVNIPHETLGKIKPAILNFKIVRICRKGVGSGDCIKWGRRNVSWDVGILRIGDAL